MTPEELLTMLTEGSMADYGREHGHLRCDTCLTEIHAPAEVGLYATNIDIESGGPALNSNITFCEECRPTDLPIRTRGIVEILLNAHLKDEGGIPAYSNPRIVTTSKSDDGVEWSPPDVWTAVTQIPFEEMEKGMAGRDSAATPGHVWGVLSTFGVDVTDLVDENGTYVASEEQEQEARQKAMEWFTSQAR